MEVPEKLIRSEYIDEDNKIFLIIVQFHRNGIINDQSLNHYFKSLKNKTLNRKVNTYHSKINDQWYDQMSMYNIIKEIYADEDRKLKMPKNDIPFDVILKYLNRYENKVKNFCVDALYYQFIKPLIEHYEDVTKYNYWNDYNSSKFDSIIHMLQEFGFNLNVQMYYNFQPSGYCCEDCDGDYEQYKESQFRHYQGKYNVTLIKDVIHRYITNMYTPDYMRNPTKKPLT